MSCKIKSKSQTVQIKKDKSQSVTDTVINSMSDPHSKSRTIWKPMKESCAKQCADESVQIQIYFISSAALEYVMSSTHNTRPDIVFHESRQHGNICWQTDNIHICALQTASCGRAHAHSFEGSGAHVYVFAEHV